MAENPYTAEVSLSGGRAGEAWTLEFDYAALSAMRAAGTKIAAAGDDPIDAMLTQMVRNVDVRIDVLLFGLARHHSDVTREAIIKESFPARPAADAVMRAIGYAIWGPEGPPKEAPQDTARPPTPPPSKND